MQRTVIKNMGSRGVEERGRNGTRMAFSRLVYPIILRFSHYPVVSPFRGPQFIIFPLSLSLSLCSSFVSSPLSRVRRRILPPSRCDREEEDGEREGGIVAKVRYRCRRGDTGVARITVTAAALQEGESGLHLARSFAPSHPFRCFERHATSRTVDPPLSGFHFERERKFRRLEGFADAPRINNSCLLFLATGKTWLVVELEAGLIIFDESGVDWGVEIQVLRD